MPNCKQCEKPGCRNKFCPKSCGMKYRHAHKGEYADYFKRLTAGASSRRKPRANCIQCGNPITRSAHSFCSHQCYFTYKTEHPEEYESGYASMREQLRKRADRACDNCQQVYRPWRTDSRFCSNECFVAYRAVHPEEFPRNPESQRRGYAKFAARTEEYAEWCQQHSDRMKANNPMRDPAVLKKAMESCREYWDSHPEEKNARIQRFMQAPLRGRGKEWKPTSLEVKIIELGIDGLKYVGDGSLYLTIGPDGSRRKKNPDFILPGKKKVVEVGHTYWHPAEEINRTVEDYSCIGYECLYLTNDDLVDRPKYEEAVRRFCSSN